jgi:hypothetical protein
MEWWWSWLLTFMGVSGLYLAGNKSTWGWVIGIAAQVLWISYAIATTQWGFLFSAFVYGGVYIRNFIKWKKENESNSSISGDS